MKRTIKDAIYGVAVGDALGVPVEFKRRDTYTVTDMMAYGTYHQPKGTWSDDTSLTLATSESIRRKGCVDVADILANFRRWLGEAAFTAGGVVFDVGNTTAQAIRQGYGQTGEYANGNGSLMRIIPLAFVQGVTAQEIAQVSAITHGHAVSCTACVLYVGIAQQLLQGKSIMAAVRSVVPVDSYFANLREIDALPRDAIKSSGYVVDSFEAAIWCLATTDTYQACVLKAVNLGSDTDTIGAIAGGLAGIIYGYDAIPAHWLAVLQNKEGIEACL